MRHFFILVLLFLSHQTLFSQQKYLQNGPMLGYVDMKEAMLWAQTTQSAKVFFEYWPTDKPGEVHKTETVITEKTTGYTAHCVADEVEPGIAYTYRLKINKKAVTLPYPTTFTTQSLWQWRTDPPAFSVATGSCNYINEPQYDRPGKPYGSEHQIFKAITAQKPDVMLWLGDNTYYREPDWNTRTGMYHRYTHDRALPELQALLASTAHYAIWDDHDYGPNDSDGTWPKKDLSLEVFKSFWANPSYGLPDMPGCHTIFMYNDIEFFLLDNRYYRTPNFCKTCPDRSMIGVEQREWLLAALANSRAPFKIVAVGGQFLSTSTNGETFFNMFKADRDTILARIERENIKNVVFLTGDKHYTDLSMLTNARGNVVYDLTASAFTSGPFTGAGEKDPNELRVPGTAYDNHNFAMLRFSGARKERQMEIAIYNPEGKEIWKRVIKSQ